MTGRSKVYFITAGPGHPIKIGISVHPERRLREIQTGHAHRLRIIHLEDGDASREAELHNRWAYARMHGEWFKPTPDILNYVRHTPNRAAGRTVELLRPLAALPAGAWTILLALLGMLSPRHRRRRIVYRAAGTGIAAAGVSIFAHGMLTAPLAWSITVAAVIFACFAAERLQSK